MGSTVLGGTVTSWAVNSVTGNDLNSGQSVGAPFLTIAKAVSVAVPGDTISLACGSRFREQITGLPVGIKIRAYGQGNRPIIDGRDIALNANFSKTGGFTNVYQISWTHSLVSTGKCAHRAWENGAMMTRASSIANCDATPGSFYAATPTDGGPDLIYVHPTGSTNPITNGREYQLTRRRWCVQLYEAFSQADVIGIEAIGNGEADGAICTNGYVEDCVVRDGRIHNFFVLGTAVNCQALGIEFGFGTLFVSYIDPGFGAGPAEPSVLYRGCYADAGANGILIEAYYAHSNGQGRVFGTIQWDNCYAANCRTGWGGSEAKFFLNYRCTYNAVATAYALGALTRVVVLGGTGRLAGVDSKAVSTGASHHTVHGIKCQSTAGGAGPIQTNSQGFDILIDRCTFNCPAGGSIQYIRGNVTVRRTIVVGNNILNPFLGNAGGQVGSYLGDRNVYLATNVGDTASGKAFGGTVFYVTLADWRTYLTSVGFQELLTIAANPQLGDPANGIFTIGNPQVLALGAGAAIDETTDPELMALYNQYKIPEGTMPAATDISNMVVQVKNATLGFQDTKTIAEMGAAVLGAVAGEITFSNGVKIITGTGTPEGAVVAPVGSIFLRSDHANVLYAKQTGTGNTGWVLK